MDETKEDINGLTFGLLITYCAFEALINFPFKYANTICLKWFMFDCMSKLTFDNLDKKELTISGLILLVLSSNLDITTFAMTYLTLGLIDPATMMLIQAYYGLLNIILTPAIPLLASIPLLSLMSYKYIHQTLKNISFMPDFICKIAHWLDEKITIFTAYAVKFIDTIIVNLLVGCDNYSIQGLRNHSIKETELFLLAVQCTTHFILMPFLVILKSLGTLIGLPYIDMRYLFTCPTTYYTIGAMMGLNLTYFTAKWSFHYTYQGYKFSSRKSCEFANAAKDFTFNLFSNNKECDKPNIPANKAL